MARYPTSPAYRGMMRYERDRDEHGRPANARPRDRFGRPLPRGAHDEMAHAREPADVVETLPEAFAHAAELFDAERFFEAHEFFEHIWKSDWVEPEDKNFWKGVTQVAVGCCHTQRENDTGARSLLERAARYLDAYPTPYHDVDTATLAAAARDLVARIDEHGAHPDHDFPRFPHAASDNPDIG